MTTPPGNPEPTKLTIYVSGPMTGYEDFNRPAFHAAAAKLRAKGFTVVNPAEHDEDHSDWKWEDFIRADVKLLMDCDAVATLPEHEASKGAALECHIARELGMRVRPLMHWLYEPVVMWLR